LVDLLEGIGCDALVRDKNLLGNTSGAVSRSRAERREEMREC